MRLSWAGAERHRPLVQLAVVPALPAACQPGVWACQSCLKADRWWFASNYTRCLILTPALPAPHPPPAQQSLGIVEASQQLQLAADAARPPRPKAAPRKRKMYEIEVSRSQTGWLAGCARGWVCVCGLCGWEA